jgi:hypothetical protein
MIVTIGPNTTLAPPIWIAVMGLSKKYSPTVSLILWHLPKQFMVPPSAINTLNYDARNIKQIDKFC